MTYKLVLFWLICRAKHRGLVRIDSVAETNRCFLKCTFAAGCESFNYSCHHGVLEEKATPGINTQLQWYVESVLPGQPLLGLWVNIPLEPAALWEEAGAGCWGAVLELIRVEQRGLGELLGRGETCM